MVIAVAEGRPVGIDLEQIRTDIDPAGIPDLFFSPRERAALATLPAGLLPTALFTCWTRKESVVKALGRGLTVPLDTLDVGVESDGDGREFTGTCLALRSLPVGPSFAATVAGAVDPLRFWHY